MIEMKQYLVETFNFNDYANKNILKKIKVLPDKVESIKFLSHLINSQNKWRTELLNISVNLNWIGGIPFMI